jgi:hypothetical protein
MRTKEILFEIKWKGYDENECTWESFKNFSQDTPELV